jgi:hypothetical protein
LQQENQGNQERKIASLRDLCPEDKQRVANLIKELAKYISFLASI